MARMNGIMGVVVSSVAVLFEVVVGWFFFVSPQRSKADALSTQVAAAKSELSGDEQLIATAKKKKAKKSSAGVPPATTKARARTTGIEAADDLLKARLDMPEADLTTGESR